MNRIAAVLFLFSALTAPAIAHDLSTMYDHSVVAREQPRLSTRVTEIYEKAFRPNLLPEEQQALFRVRFDFPLEGEPVLGYYSNAKTGVVTMPAVALLFFEDLCTAYAWLYTKGYRLETVEEYLTMLKYKSPQAFGGRYPSPLRALSIPADALSDPRVSNLSLRFRNSGYAFILGHELGHIRYRHPFYNEVPVTTSQSNEEQADLFALELMRRVTTIPMGGMLFFQAGIYYFENRADFASDHQWQEFLAKSATHPLTARRLRALSDNVSRLAPSFASGDPNRAAAIETVHFIGQRFAEFANFLDDPTLQRVMRAKAEKSPPSSLAPRRTRETLQDFR